MSRRHVTGAIIALCMLFASGAGAQQSKPGQDISVAEARARFEEGVKLGEANDHEAARLKFSLAWSLMKSPTILYNLARAERLTNRNVDAIEHYRQFSKWPSDPKVTDAQRERANEAIKELSSKVAQIQIKAVPGARITIDGRSQELANDDLVAVEPGKHKIDFIADGKVTTVEVDCAIGATCPADGTETEAPASVSPPPLVDAKPAAETRTSSPGFWTMGRAVGLGLAAVGVGGVVLGVVFHGEVESDAEEATRIREQLGRSGCAGTGTVNPACSKLRTVNDSQATNEALRGAFLIGGGAFVVGGAVLFLVSSPSKKETAAVRVLPIASGDQLGAFMTGRF